RADGAARPQLASDRAAVCLIDNRDGLPYVSSAWAIDEVIQRARRNGIGFAGITNSTHVGVLGIHLLPVAEAGMVGVAFTNSPAAIPPWGGKTPLFGTDPVAFAFPRKSGDPLVIDLALTTVVRGKIMLAMQKGEKIPEGWALDRNGKPTTDPKEAIERGSLFPIGGAKGAMLALAFELVCASLTGSAIGAEADSFFSEQGNKPRIGQAFPAMNVGIRTEDETLIGVRYLPGTAPLKAPQNRFAERVVLQLERYRDDPDTSFDLPLTIGGTEFQQKVWRVMQRIPRGKTRTYGDVAKALGSAARAVGQACGENRLPIIIPCHRIIAA